jgi:uridine kinase
MIPMILDAVRRLKDERDRPIVVALDGRSGAGKSTLANTLAGALRATCVPSDDFFAAEITAEGWGVRSAAERARDAIDWQRLRQTALEPLLAGRPAVWHSFDFAAGTRDDGTYAMSSDRVRRNPAAVIILDGAYSTRPELADLVDFAVLVEASQSVRSARLAAREDPGFLAAWYARWEAAEDYYFTHVRPPAAFDMVVDTCDF